MTLPYYQYNFVSPEPLYAEIKEELRSYFESGALDDTLFSLWTEKCLKKMGRGMYKIKQTLLSLDEGVATLPPSFKGIRELWLCETLSTAYQHPSATYSYVLNTSTRIDHPDVSCDVCNECRNPPVIQAMYKTTHTVFRQFSRKYLLTPGNPAWNTCADMPCANEIAADTDKYFIEDGKLHVGSETGTLFMVYYDEERDETGYQLIPDNVYIQEYIEHFIKYKLWQMLFNTASDESFNQLRYKTESAKQEYLDKQVIAENFTKKETLQQKAAKIERQRTRLNRYKLR